VEILLVSYQFPRFYDLTFHYHEQQVVPKYNQGRRGVNNVPKEKSHFCPYGYQKWQYHSTRFECIAVAIANNDWTGRVMLGIQHE
jgi:hypothetical protein